jgi:DNA polymerase-3 subunit delta'
MSLSGVLGQENALRMLRGAMRRGRLAAAYLFTGEPGVGKRHTAVNFAKALNCLRPVEGEDHRDACEACPSCRKIASGSHPDFMMLVPENDMIKVGQIRGIEESLSYKAYEGRTRVVVVDDAELMNISAANAFLKTLEEPAAGSMIILVSSAPEMLPETIRSRCSRVNFRPLSTEAAMQVILGLVKGKKAAEARTLARLSMGRPGLALGEDLLRKRARFLAAMEKMLDAGGKPTWRDRQEMKRWFDMSLLFLRDMAVQKITGSDEALINADIAEKVRAAGGGAPLEVIISCYERLLGVRNNLGFNLNKGITWNYAGSVMGELTADG